MLIEKDGKRYVDLDWVWSEVEHRRDVQSDHYYTCKRRDDLEMAYRHRYCADQIERLRKEILRKVENLGEPKAFGAAIVGEDKANQEEQANVRFWERFLRFFFWWVK